MPRTNIPKTGNLTARQAARDAAKIAARKVARKAEILIKAPLNKHDITHKNPFLNNKNHTEHINRIIKRFIKKFGRDAIVVTHFRDGTAIGTADKAIHRRDNLGRASLLRAKKIEDKYIWIGLENPVSSVTVV